MHLLPSTALAIGYYQNFLQPICQRLAQQQKVEVNGQQVDISKGNFDFTIVLPKTLPDASTHGAAKFVKSAAVGEFKLQHGSACRRG